MDPLTDGVVIALVPGLVEIAKRAGLPTRFAGIAAIAAATSIFALNDLAVADGNAGAVAGWIVKGVIAGLASAGLYSQAVRLGDRR